MLQALLSHRKNIAKDGHRFPLTWSEADRFHYQVMLPKFTYFLPQCSFGKQQLIGASAGVQQACVLACGYNGCMSLAI